MDSISKYFFTVSPKVPDEVVGSGQNKNLLWECDHWTKVRLRRENTSPLTKIAISKSWPPEYKRLRRNNHLPAGDLYLHPP